MRKTVGILGAPIDRLDRQETLARLEQFIAEGRFHQVATANTDFLVNALVDPELRRILRVADLVTPDGMPVVWSARLVRATLPERVTGVDLIPALAERAAEKGYRLYLLGAREEIACRAKARLEADYPGLRIVGCVSPPEGPLPEMDSEALLQDIERARPDILLVAFGNPKQEKWIYRHRDRLSRVPVCMGVGGAFDFLAGHARRAPLWMQRRGLEWLHRLIREPGRLWRRYNRDFWTFGLQLARQAWAMRRWGPAKTGALQVASEAGYALFTLAGAFDGAALTRFHAAVETALAANQDLFLDLRGVTALDGEALGALLNLPQRALRAQREVWLLGTPPRIARLLQIRPGDDSLYRFAESPEQARAGVEMIGRIPSPSPLRISG